MIMNAKNTNAATATAMPALMRHLWLPALGVGARGVFLDNFNSITSSQPLTSAFVGAFVI
jgi:hypothetical protein